MSNQQKYYKYKNKYIQLKQTGGQQNGGSCKKNITYCADNTPYYDSVNKNCHGTDKCEAWRPISPNNSPIVSSNLSSPINVPIVSSNLSSPINVPIVSSNLSSPTNVPIVPSNKPQLLIWDKWDEEISDYQKSISQDKPIERKLLGYKETLDNFKLYEKIIGPSALTVYKIGEKYIFFFRDIHISSNKECAEFLKHNKDKCIQFDDFLNDLFLTAPYCIDFFLETISFLQIPKNEIANSETKLALEGQINLLRDQKNDQGIMINKLTGKYVDCLGPLKKNCDKFEKVRFHNIEFRRFVFGQYNFWPDEITSIFVIPLIYLLNDKTNYNISNKTVKNSIDVKNFDWTYRVHYLKNINKYKKLFENIVDGDMDSLSENILSLFEGFSKSEIVKEKLGNWKQYFQPDILKTISPYPKLNKQIIALNNEMQQHIKKYIKLQFNNEIEKHIVKINTNVDKFNNTEDLEIFKKQTYIANIFEEVEKIIMLFAVYVLDAYTIARVMKSYTQYDSSVIIIYAGDDHIKNYLSVIDHLNSSNLLKVTDKKNIGYINDQTPGGCIDLYKNVWDSIMDNLKNVNAISGICSKKSGIDESL